MAAGQGSAAAHAAAQNSADLSLNGPDHPAPVGSVLTVYLTGIGPVDNPVPTGQAPPADPLSRATLPYNITIGGQGVTVNYLGLTPTSIGLAQANVVVPNLPPGDYPIVITIAGVSSNTPLVTIAGN